MTAAASSIGVLEHDGLKLRYRTEGSGPHLFLLHGMGASLYSFRGNVSALAKAFTVHAFDWPGYGRSDQPLDFDYSPDGYSRLLLSLMDRFGAAKAHLVGNSMGGLVGLWTALHHPGRVDRLALIGVPVYPGDQPQILWPLRWPVIGAAYERLLGPWAVPIVAKTVFVDKSLITPEMVEEYSFAMRTAGGPRAVATFLRRAVPPDPWAFVERYKAMTHPTLVLRGEADGVVSRASVDRFGRDHKGATVVHLPGVGHAPHEERPDAVNPLLLRFLGGS